MTAPHGQRPPPHIPPPPHHQPPAPVPPAPPPPPPQTPAHYHYHAPPPEPPRSRWLRGCLMMVAITVGGMVIIAIAGAIITAIAGDDDDTTTPAPRTTLPYTGITRPYVDTPNYDTYTPDLDLPTDLADAAQRINPFADNSAACHGDDATTLRVWLYMCVAAYLTEVPDTEAGHMDAATATAIDARNRKRRGLLTDYAPDAPLPITDMTAALRDANDAIDAWMRGQ